MANDTHSQLIETDEIHVPKGFNEASDDTLPVRRSGQLVWELTSEVAGPQGEQGIQGPVFLPDHVIRVSKNPQAGEFSSITAAYASFSDESSSSPYLIEIGPGTFIENTIVSRRHIYIRGAGQDATIIKPVDPTQTVILASINAGIQMCTIRGANGIGGIGIKHVDQDCTYQIINCTLRDNETHIYLEGVAGVGTRLFVYQTRFREPWVKCIEIHGDNGVRTEAFVKNILAENIGVASFDSFVHAHGTDAHVNIDCGLIFGDPGASPKPTGCGVESYDGATINISSANIAHMDCGIKTENIGADPILNMAGTLLHELDNDIIIEHPGTKGVFQGTANRNNMTIDAGSTLSLTISDFNPATGESGLVNLGSLRIGHRIDNLLDLTYIAEKAMPLGLYTSHDVLSKSVTPFEVLIESGRRGYLEVSGSPDEYYEVNVQDTPVTVAANSNVYLVADKDGVVSSLASLPNTRYQVVLGRVITDSTGILYIENAPPRGYHATNQLIEFAREAIGGIYVSGSTVSESTTPYDLDVGSGIYWFGENRKTPSGGTNVSFIQHYRDGSGGWVTSQTQVVNSNSYDDGSGTLQSYTAGYFGKARLYISGDAADETYFLIMPQDQHATQQAAEDSAAPIVPSYFRDITLPIADVIVENGSANIANIISARPLLTTQAAAGGGTTNHGDLAGLLDDHHTQYMLVSGARAMGGSLNMGTNDITNVGLVDGVDVSAHASRHLPNGSDPISTATAVNITAGGASSEGTANSLARSDHEHGIRLKHYGSTEMNLQQLQDQNHSAGTIQGFELTANGTTPENLDVAAGTCLVRSASTDVAELGFYAYPGSVNNALTDGQRNYIYINYNAGSPALQITTTKRTDYHQNAFLGSVFRDGTDLHISANTQVKVSDHASAMVRRLDESIGYTRVSGGDVTEVGTRNFAISAGVFWYSLNKFSTTAKNTQTTDDFTYFYNRAAWAKEAGGPFTQINNAQYDNAGTLTAMTASYYRADYVYLEEDGDIGVIYGNAEYSTLSEAKADPLPTSLPGQLLDHSILIGKVIVQQGAASFALLLNSRTDQLVVDASSVDLSYYLDTATVDDTVASVTYVQIDSMTRTPASGTWSIEFSASGNTSGTAADGEYVIYVDGSPVAHTERNANFGGGGQASDFDVPMHSQHIATLNGAQTVAVYARVNTGNFIVHERSLKLVKIGN